LQNRTSTPARELADRMRDAALAWLATLPAAARTLACGPGPGDGDAADRERVTWFYTPTDHGGLALNAQRPAQQSLAMQLVATGLSEPGYVTVSTLLGWENVLDRVEGWRVDWGRERGRDPGLFWLRVFGDPGGPDWAWRFGGHHVSLNNLIRGGEVVAASPCFLGADPAVAPLLGGAALRPLGGIEGLGRSLVRSLDRSQLGVALLHEHAISDIVSGNRARLADQDEMMHMQDLWRGQFAEQRLIDLVDRIDERAETGSGYGADDHRRLALTTQPKGIAGADLDAEQRRLLRHLLAGYVDRLPDAVAARWRSRYAGDDGLAAVHFAWAGPVGPGEPVYYRVQGPALLIEYDNTQRGANHAHSVLRDPSRDFGLSPGTLHG
jgi:hypothetical protein